MLMINIYNSLEEAARNAVPCDIFSEEEVENLKRELRFTVITDMVDAMMHDERNEWALMFKKLRKYKSALRA